ncbi:hypothetical protein BDV93DRAFT_603777 [Ceratobasidium sp. AG-I]|nr:hypothetical protein BDV93DRAFT_603777 [Ceratobasidium sp. AG-I]
MDKQLTLSPRSTQDGGQTPGAGPSCPRPPHVNPPSQAGPRSHLEEPRVQLATHTGAAHQEVELGVYLAPDFAPFGSLPPSPSGGAFPRRGSNGSIVTKVANVGENFFLANSIWRTDIFTFCSHARLDAVLGSAQITHIQARKSRRPPFLHEYILVFFTAAGNRRFVLRIDRLGKIGSGPSGWPLGWCTGRHGVAANTAIQEVGMYHIQDSQIGIDSPDGAWLAMDGMWGSHPIATLATWKAESERGGHVSHHVQTAADMCGAGPQLEDVSRLLEAILLEMPTYHLTTTNCYLMTRSSLLLMQRCYPSAFACHLGAMSDELVPSSSLAEPVWAGILRWYLPFVILFFLFYIPLLICFHVYIGRLVNCHALDDCVQRSVVPRPLSAFLHSLHSIVDVPLPVGLMHAYMTALEQEMNDLVVRLSVRFLDAAHPAREGAPGATPPFETLINGAWTTLLAWCALGIGFAIFFFFAFWFKYGPLISFILILIMGLWFNFKFGGDAFVVLEETENIQ